MDANHRSLPLAEEPRFPGRAEAPGGARAYSQSVGPRTDRPLTTALGWRLPGRLLDIGPVAFIFLVGGGALAAKHAVGDASHGVLLLGLFVITAALLVRHRAPLSVLGLALALEVALGWGPVVLFPVLLALFNVAEYTERSIVIGATLVDGRGDDRHAGHPPG